MPNSHIPKDSHESSSILKLSPEDVAIAGKVERGRFFPHTRLDLDSVHEPEWLLEGEIVARAYNLIYGPSGSGKTFYLVDILRRASAIGFVVYIATEDTAGLKVRVMAQEKAFGVNLDNFGWIDEPIDLANDKDVDDLIRDLASLAPVLVIIDTLAMAHSGDENSNQDMSIVNRAARKIIAETGAAVAVVHHTGVNEGRERGATALMGNVDLKVKVIMDDDVILISQEKVRNGKPADPRRFRLTDVTLTLQDKHGNPIKSAVIRPAADVTMRGAALTTQQRSILEALALEVFAVAGAKGSQLMANVPNLASSSFYRTISLLIKRGLVWQNKKGDPFYITDAGRDEIAPEYMEPPYTPEGYDSDSSDTDADSHDSQPIPNGFPSSHENQSTSLSNSTSPTPTHYSVGERENWERDSKVETELFPDEPTPAPRIGINDFSVDCIEKAGERSYRLWHDATETVIDEFDSEYEARTACTSIIVSVLAGDSIALDEFDQRRLRTSIQAQEDKRTKRAIEAAASIQNVYAKVKRLAELTALPAQDEQTVT